MRGPGLADSMSRYLISRIEACREITVKPWTEIQALEGDSSLKRVTWRDKQTAATESREIKHVFSMTGANPNTGWLGECLALDQKQFVKTGDRSGYQLVVASFSVYARDQPPRRLCGWRYPGRQREASRVGGG